MQKIIDGGMFDSTSVVETVDGFPRGDKAVDAAFFARMMRCFYRDGILRPTDGGFAVLPENGMSVRIAPGVAWIGGRMAFLDEAASFPLTAGCAYAVTVRLDLDHGAFSVEVTEDNGSAPVRTASITELLLARVSVPAGAETVTAEMITDKRMDDTVCGAVGGLTAEMMVPRSGCTMTGVLRCGNETAGASAVRNIRYGKTLPDTLADGEIFLLLADA